MFAVRRDHEASEPARHSEMEARLDFFRLVLRVRGPAAWVFATVALVVAANVLLRMTAH